jgi:alpha-glucosidase
VTRPILLAATAVFLAANLQGAEDVVTVKSPNGRIEFRMFDGQPWETDLPHPHLVYNVDFNGKPLIEASHLGYDIDSALPLGHKLGLVTQSSEAVDETYSLVSGKSKTIRNHYNEVVAEYLQNGSLGRRMTMEVRAFDDGVAFRYVIAATPQLLDFNVTNEITEFVFAKDGDAYPLILRDFQTGYEDQFSKITLSGIHPDSLIGLPFLVEQPGVGWVAVTEADLDDYAGLYLQHGEGRLMHARLSPRVDGSGLALQLKTPVVSPWRVLLIADRPEKLIESNIVTSLNRPSKLSETSWIQPGKAITATNPKEAIDFAAEAGLEYAMIDGNQSDLPGVLAYAKQKKVGVWLASDRRTIESTMDEAFPRFEAWGVRGIQIDGMNRDDQSMVEFYHKVAAQAAEHRLMLDFHDAYKPDGMQRTFPNVITTEAAMGSEYAKQGARVTPEHNVMLAFTRMLAGPMDYSPGGFKNATREQFQPGQTLGTQAHQLALFVIFESGLQRLADTPAAYRGEKDFDFIRAVPATWDETRALNGEVGQYLTVARSRGSEWFLGAITNWTARDVDAPLGFLGPGQYDAEIYSDTARETRRVNSADTMHLHLASGGGTAIRFRRVNEARP